MGASTAPGCAKSKASGSWSSCGDESFRPWNCAFRGFYYSGAPKLTADGAGIPVGDVIAASVPLVIVMGIVTTVTAFWLLKRDIKLGVLKVDELERSKKSEIKTEDEILHMRDIPSNVRKALAALVPILFAIDLIIMYTAKLQGGDATALIGGTSMLILIIISFFGYKANPLERITDHLIEGLQFGFKVFGPVIPIAAFFTWGIQLSALFLEKSCRQLTGLVNDLGIALAEIVPLNSVVGAVTATIVGSITGLDGSGFSGITLAGSIAGCLLLL